MQDEDQRFTEKAPNLFKRGALAQAQCDGMTLAARDPLIQKYDVDLLRL